MRINAIIPTLLVEIRTSREHLGQAMQLRVIQRSMAQ